MKIILYRYLVKEQLVPVGVCFLGLSLILITGRLLQLTRLLFQSSLTVADLTEVMALAMPELILYTLPMASLTGVLLAFVRLNSDSELIAIRAAGIGFKQFFPAVLSVLLLTTFLSFINTICIVPSANLAFKEKIRSLGRASIPALLQEGTFIDMIPNLVFFFRSVNATNLSIEGIFVQDRRKQDIQLSIVAERAQIVTQRDMRSLTFKIANGIITRVAEDLKDAQAISFKAYDLTLSLDEMFGAASGSSKGKREMSLKELLEMIGKAGMNTDLDVRYALEIHRRLALPVGCLLLGLLGAPLGALFRQRSRMTGITLGLAAFLAYYVILSAGNGIGKNGLVPPSVAMWTPNFLAFILVCYLWAKLQQETPFRLAALWEYARPHVQTLVNLCRRRKGHTT